MSLPASVFKGHATANDFVIYADPDGDFEPSAQETREICNRHTGIGGDGLIRLTRTRYVSNLSAQLRTEIDAHGAQWFMDYRNADGSLAQMCGNGTRLTALLAQKLSVMGASVGSEFVLGTRAGIKKLVYRGDNEKLGRNVFTVHMGDWAVGCTGEYSVSIPGSEGTTRATYANLGNPHIVSIVASHAPQFPLSVFPESNLVDVEKLDLSRTPTVEPALSEGQNAEFVRVDSIKNVVGSGGTHENKAFLGHATMRVNERGVGETLSCGTGLCATAIVLHKIIGISNWDITVPGGLLTVNVTKNDVALTGASTLIGETTLI